MVAARRIRTDDPIAVRARSGTPHHVACLADSSRRCCGRFVALVNPGAERSQRVGVLSLVGGLVVNSEAPGPSAPTRALTVLDTTRVARVDVWLLLVLGTITENQHLSLNEPMWRIETEWKDEPVGLNYQEIN